MVLRLQSSLSLLLCLFCVRFQESLCYTFGKLPSRPSQGVRLYIAGESKEISNFSVIRADQFFDLDYTRNGSGPPDGINDGLWCQSANNNANIGTWYLPNGKPVPTEDIDGNANMPLHAYNNASGQVGLLRDDKIGLYEGIFKCVIADEKGVNATLVVAIYSVKNYHDSVGPEVPSDPLQFSLISTRDAIPSVFTLSFNVTHRPPTDVICIKDDSLIIKIDKQKDLSREIIQSTIPIIVQVTVTLREGGSGVYTCNVSNARVDNKNVYPSTTPSKRVTAGGTPVNLTAVRFSSTTATLSWVSAVANDSFVKGFEVFYNNLSGSKESVLVSKMKTNVTLTGLSENVEYSAFVVSYSDLPSERSNIVIIPAEYESHSFEVCGSNFLPCETWDTNITTSIKSFIKSALVDAVREKYQCDVSIINEVLTCDSTISNQIKYRANITGVKSFSSYELASFIEQWVFTDVILRNGFSPIKLHTKCLISSDIEKNITCTQMKTATKTETSTIVITSTSTTTVTITASPIVYIPLSSSSSQSMISIVTPLLNSVVISDSISTLVITGIISVLITAVIMMSIFILLLILIKKKYDRSICRSSRSVYNNSAVKKYPSMSDFEMMECAAYQSANEHNTVVYDQLITSYRRIEDSTHHHLSTPPPSSSPSPQPPLSQEERTATIIYETII